jgi:ankyrin repeat protein
VSCPRPSLQTAHAKFAPPFTFVPPCRDAEDIDALATCEATDKDMHSWVDDVIGANGESDVTAMTGLLKACESGNVATVKHLLSGRYRASVHKKCKSEATPLFYAAANGHPSIIALLHKQRADVNAQVPNAKDGRIITGQTPLCIAAKFGHTECVKRLLDLKADATKTNSRRQRPLDIAMEPSSALRAHQFHKIVGLLQRNLDSKRTMCQTRK